MRPRLAAGFVLFALAGCGSENSATPPPAPELAPPVPEPVPIPVPVPELGRARVTSDQPDDFPGPQIHVVYAVASDGEDHEIDTNGLILEMLENAQAFLEERISQRFRLDTYEGEPDVSFVRLRDWAEDELIDLAYRHELYGTLGRIAPDTMWRALKGEISRDPRKHYAVFYTFDLDGHYILGSANATGATTGGFAGTYISDSWLRHPNERMRRTFAVTMIHEVFHLMGAVPRCAPNDGNGPHVTDHDLDVMNNNNVPLSEKTHIDFGRDDYYGHGRSDCTDISESPYFEPAS